MQCGCVFSYCNIINFSFSVAIAFPSNFSHILVSLRIHTKPTSLQFSAFTCIWPFFPHQCSTSCGEGTQTRSAVCRKVLKTGVSSIVNSSLCPPLPFSSSIRPCMLATCASEYVSALGWGESKSSSFP